MSHTIIAAARQLQAEIRRQEDNLDLTIAGQARLLGALLDARRTANVPARVGTAALDKAFEAIGHGRMLRESMLAMHQELAALNLRELAVGDVSDCPTEGFGGLTVVASSSRHAA